MAPFDGKDVMAERQRQKIVSDQVLVGAGSVPCTLNFKFENKFSWILEVTYRIRVIPPPRNILSEGRRRRAKAGLQALDYDLNLSNQRFKDAYNRRLGLEREVEQLRRELESANQYLRSAADEEYRQRTGGGGPGDNSFYY